MDLFELREKLKTVSPARAMIEPYFNVYLCHICKTKESFYKSKYCSGCKLISYCSPEHQRLHWQAHRELCKGVQKACAYYSITPDDLYTVVKFNDHIESPRLLWINVKWNILVHLQRDFVKRRLDRLETCLVFNPQKCPVCYATNKIKKDLVCKKCFSVGYCSEEHQASHIDSHQQDCCEFLKVLEMELFYKKNTFWPLTKLEKKIDLKDLDMEQFIKQHLSARLTFQQEAMTSFDFTAILTFVHAMKQFPRLTERKTLTVHIVGARDGFEVVTKDQWKYLSPFFPSLCTVTLIFVGPEVEYQGDEKTKLCSIDGPKKTKFIHLYFRRSRYHEAFENKIIGKPDAIVAFNSGMYDRRSEDLDGPSWGPTISLFLKLQTPIILTAYTLEEARLDLERIAQESEACGVKIKVLLNCVENPFRSLRPFRFQESVAYKNRFMSVIDFESE